jgi:1-acyl-sn-glycerol-3-phosphate acyltransferase
MIRSAIYFLWFAIVSVVMNVVCLPILLLPRQVTLWAAKRWCAVLLWGLKVIAGLDLEVRGPIPQGAVLVASKHMSMWDTLVLVHLLADPAVVLKRELLNIPFYGWYVRKARMIAIDRATGASALRKMAQAARNALGEGRSIAIFPEGTRKKPGAPADYKPGVAALYAQLGVACVPVALNSGLFWTIFRKNPGRIVIEFLPAIPAGLKRAEFMGKLEQEIETATAALLAEGRDLLKKRDRS